MTIDPSIPVVINDKVELVVINYEKVSQSKVLVMDEKSSEKPLINKHEAKLRKGIEKKAPKVLPLITRSPSFLQRLKKKVEEGKY